MLTTFRLMNYVTKSMKNGPNGFESEEYGYHDSRTSAKKRGVKFGRKFKLTTHQQDQVRTMLQEGQSIRALARHFNVGVATIDRIKRSTQLS